ncbi:hypothetical protein ACJ2CR_04340 [Myxococcus faecalis]|uniref:hypothetical protein n=1 Tax=Myxococcus faecalis TaxID=3115646 RepID=UPI0038D0402B
MATTTTSTLRLGPANTRVPSAGLRKATMGGSSSAFTSSVRLTVFVFFSLLLSVTSASNRTLPAVEGRRRSKRYGGSVATPAEWRVAPRYSKSSTLETATSSSAWRTMGTSVFAVPTKPGLGLRNSTVGGRSPWRVTVWLTSS